MIQVEYTDAYGGQANYSWVECRELQPIDGESDLALMRRIKKSLGINSLKGRYDYQGNDQWIWRPYGRCTVLFVDFF